MNQPTKIACAAAIHVGQMVVTAIVLCAACEAVNWFLGRQDARKEG